MSDPQPADRLVLSRAELAALDRAAVEELGLASAVLMENAGRGAAEHVLASLAGRRRVTIVCGPGNNGGDGYVVARHLWLAGCEVQVDSIVDLSSLRGDAAVNATAAQRLGIAVRCAVNAAALAECTPAWTGADVLVDALLGTGALPPPRPFASLSIDAFNAALGPLKVALDLPSGLDADSGATPGACVRADLTVTFAALKRGFDSAQAREVLGRVVVVGIGIPADLAVGRVSRP